MHTIEPFHHWRYLYTAEEDDKSPFFGRTYSEFEFSNKIYNYYIHPQWDDFDSETLYAKILFCNYEDSHCIIELIGEWNDIINNDVLFLKQNLIDPLQANGLSKFIIICEQVMNFHGSDDSYYEEWKEDTQENDGYIFFVHPLDHVYREMKSTGIHHQINLIEDKENIPWRKLNPTQLFQKLEEYL